MDATTVLLLVVAASALVASFASARSGPSAGDALRLARIERKLDRVLRHLGIEEEQQDDADIRALVREGAKINAIKVYRQRHGVGLKEAKGAVDAIWAEENGPGQ